MRTYTQVQSKTKQSKKIVDLTRKIFFSFLGFEDPT